MNDLNQDRHLATYLAIELKPSRLLEPDQLRLFAQDLLAAAREYTHATLAYTEIEPWSLSRLLSGQHPRSIVAITYEAMNEGRGSSDPIREPGPEDIDQYRAYFGNMIGNGTVTLLAPLVAADPLRLDQDTVCEAIDRLRAFVGQLPVTRIDFRYLDIGCVADRHGFFAPLRPVRARGEAFDEESCDEYDPN